MVLVYLNLESGTLNLKILDFFFYFLETNTHTRERESGYNKKVYHKLHLKVSVTFLKKRVWQIILHTTHSLK